MTAAQKTARANFKKAIEYRKKTGCTLKQAFAKFKKPATKKAAPKKKAVKKVVRKVAVKKVARKKVSGIKTKSKKHTDYNKPTVNIQIGAIKRGSNFSSYKGYLIEKKPITIGKKKTSVFICHQLDIVDKTLAKVKARINYLTK